MSKPTNRMIMSTKMSILARPSRRALLKFGLVVAVAMPASLTLAVTAVEAASKPAVFTGFSSKLALDGYDAVGYFTEGKPVKGDVRFAANWNGATWHFASDANRAAFQAEPARFAPQFGGYCAWAVSEGYTAKGDPAHWRIADGKLYLNYNAAVQRNWARDMGRNIARGDANWPVVLGK